jgi:ATP-dependent Lhr-like helicase
VALYFREDAALLGPPPGGRSEQPSDPEHTLLRERLAAAPCFFTDLLAELDVAAPVLVERLWDLVWSGEATNDAWAPLRAPRPTTAGTARPSGLARASRIGGRRFGGQSVRGGRNATGAQVQGRWSLTETLFAAKVDPGQRRRALAELLLERYGVLSREQVLAEGVQGGFSSLYGALSDLETLGVCRRGYFVEGLGAAQFALGGAVERLRAGRLSGEGKALVIAAVDPAQPYGAVLPWPRRESQTRRPARVAGAYVVFVDSDPVLYLERGGRGIVTLAPDSVAVRSTVGLRESGPISGASSAALSDASEKSTPLELALRALADAVRAGRVDRIALERVDGEPAIGSELEPMLVRLGFRSGPRRLTLRA